MRYNSRPKVPAKYQTEWDMCWGWNVPANVERDRFVNPMHPSSSVLFPVLSITFINSALSPVPPAAPRTTRQLSANDYGAKPSQTDDVPLGSRSRTVGRRRR